MSIALQGSTLVHTVSFWCVHTKRKVVYKSFYHYANALSCFEELLDEKDIEEPFIETFMQMNDDLDSLHFGDKQ